MGNHDARQNSPRSCRDALSKKCQRIHKTRQNKKRIYKKRTRDLCNTRREIQTNKSGSTVLKEWTTPDSRNTPSTINLEEEEIVDALGNDGIASMPERVKRPNPWRKKMMMMNYTLNNNGLCQTVQLYIFCWLVNTQRRCYTFKSSIFSKSLNDSITEFQSQGHEFASRAFPASLSASRPPYWPFVIAHTSSIYAHSNSCASMGPRKKS